MPLTAEGRRKAALRNEETKIAAFRRLMGFREALLNALKQDPQLAERFRQRPRLVDRQVEAGIPGVPKMPEKTAKNLRLGIIGGKRVHGLGRFTPKLVQAQGMPPVQQPAARINEATVRSKAQRLWSKSGHLGWADVTKKVMTQLKLPEEAYEDVAETVRRLQSESKRA